MGLRPRRGAPVRRGLVARRTCGDTGREQRDFRVGRRMLAQEELRDAVVVRRAQQRLPSADPVPRGQPAFADYSHMFSGRLPRLVPAGLVTVGDRIRGEQDLAQIAPP
jgi:hypothetical protein